MATHSVRRPPLAAIACLLGTFIATAQPGRTSSGDAWAEFEKDVRQACLSAAIGTIAVSSIQVDPFGSESYGFALMVGFEAGTTTERVVACAYDKTSQNVEISGFFDR